MAYSNMRTNVDNYFERAKAVFHIFSRCKPIRWKMETQRTEIGMKKTAPVAVRDGVCLRPCLPVPAPVLRRTCVHGRRYT